MTNDQVQRLWLESQRSDHTREAYAFHAAKLDAFLKDKPYGEVTLGDLQQFARHLQRAKNSRGKPYAPKTRQSILVAIKSLFAFASEEGHIEANPAKRLPIEKCQDNRGARTLTRDEVERLIAATDPDRPRDSLLLRLLFYSGVRVTEAVNLRWQDIRANDASGGQIAVFGKGGKNRTVGIKGELYADFMAYRRAVGGKLMDRVFTSQKAESLSRFQVDRIIKKAAKKSGVRWDASAHKFRHAFATEGLKNNASLRLIQRDLGHASLETTQIYLDVNPTEAVSDYL